MCIIAAKYFKDKGWVLAKNRDQDYVSHVSFRDFDNEKVGEILTMYDHDIHYQEGMNRDGLVIISTSLTPQIDEESNKKDGDNICKALHMKQNEAAKFLVDQKMTGYIFLATPEKLLVIEAGKMDDGKGEYKSRITNIPKTETIVRTNHGVIFPWAGFQYGVDKAQDLWRKSSESRKALAEKAIAKAGTPEEMLDALASRMVDDLQMNVFRIETKPKQMRTIFQWALVPSEGEAIIRPIQAKLKLKVSHKHLTVKMLDNEPIKKLYNGLVKHFSKIKEIDGGEGFQTAITEDRVPLRFKEYIR